MELFKNCCQISVGEVILKSQVKIIKKSEGFYDCVKIASRYLQVLISVFFFKVFIDFVTILLLFYVLFFGHKACGILALQPGIRPVSPELEGDVLTPGPPGKSLSFQFKGVQAGTPGGCKVDVFHASLVCPKSRTKMQKEHLWLLLL